MFSGIIIFDIDNSKINIIYEYIYIYIYTDIFNKSSSACTHCEQACWGMLWHWLAYKIQQSRRKLYVTTFVYIGYLLSLLYFSEFLILNKSLFLGQVIYYYTSFKLFQNFHYTVSEHFYSSTSVFHKLILFQVIIPCIIINLPKIYIYNLD